MVVDGSELRLDSAVFFFFFFFSGRCAGFDSKCGVDSWIWNNVVDRRWIGVWLYDFGEMCLDGGYVG